METSLVSDFHNGDDVIQDKIEFDALSSGSLKYRFQLSGIEQVNMLQVIILF